MVKRYTFQGVTYQVQMDVSISTATLTNLSDGATFGVVLTPEMQQSMKAAIEHKTRRLERLLGEEWQ